MRQSFAAKKKGGLAPSCNRACKPGSVPAVAGRDHLSLPCVTAWLGGDPPAAIGTPAGRRGTKVPPKGVASDRVYMASHVTAGSVSSYLAFPSLPLARRFISVALSLRSPSADVIRYPSPTKPGLSSRYYLSAPYRAAAPHGCPLIIHAGQGFVKPSNGKSCAFYTPFSLFFSKRGCIFCKI